MNLFTKVEIKANCYDYVVKRKDVWIVYTTNGKYWVCTVGGVQKNNDFYILTLATKKGKSDKND